MACLHSIADLRGATQIHSTISSQNCQFPQVDDGHHFEDALN